MIKMFVERPATTVMFILFFALLGLVSFFNLNVEESPRINFPLVNVSVVYSGASPEEIETQLIKKIEDSVVEIAEIKKIESRSFESSGYVLIEFLLSADVNDKLIEVKDKVEAILNDLPDGIDRPIVQKVDPFARSVVSLALTSKKHNLTELYEYADINLSSQFSKITGVGEVEIFGGREREIRVELFPDLMKQKFISIDQVISQIQSKNITVPAGNIEQDSTSTTVRFDGEFDSIEEVQNFRLTTSDGNSFYLKEIGRVYDGQADMETGGRFNQTEVVTLSIKKISDGNEINVSDGVQAALPSIRERLPEGMELQTALDTSMTIRRETANTYVGILIGIALTVLVLLFFTGNWRVTVVSAVVIPSSVVSSLFLMDTSGFTINFITLLAVATSLGTLIANAIVIIESILEKLKQGLPSREAAIQGTTDMIVPVLAAGGTNLVVFTPIAFMGGIIGQFMTQFGLTVVYATIFSLIASFSLTPMMCAILLKPESKDGKKSWIVRFSDKVVGSLLAEYRQLFEILFRFPKTTMAIFIALFIGSFSVAGYIGNEFIPVSDEDRIEVALTLPLGTNIEFTEQVAEEVEAIFAGTPEVDSILTTLGENGEQNASVVINLKPAAERTRSDVDLINEATPKIAEISGAEIEVIRGEGGGGQSADISVEVLGGEYEDVIKVSDQFIRIMRETGYFRSLVSSYKDPKQELQYSPDSVKLDKYGLQASQVGSVLRSSIYGDDSNIYREKGEEYDITVQLDETFVKSQEVNNDLFLISSTGLIPVTELGTFKHKKSVPTIYRRDRQRVIQLNGYLAKSTAGVVQGELTEAFSKIELPAGMEFRFVGNAESQAEAGFEIMKAFGLAVILTYMILAAIMNSFLHPFTIATSIVTSFSGVFLALFFLDSSINIASMLGFVMLVGLAVNNAILILDETLAILDREPDISLVDAIWKGIESKFRAVLMTSIAIVFGLLPQLWSPDLAKASMGAVIVGGVIASIVFTFFLTPQTFYYLEGMKRWFSRKLGSAES